MENIDPVDLNKFILSIHSDNAIEPNEIEFGALKELNGMTVGLATMANNPPHNGERHNNGDEIIIVMSGKIIVESDSNPDKCLALESGGACIIRKGEWHKIKVIEKAQLVYITPGSNNEYRF